MAETEAGAKIAGPEQERGEAAGAGRGEKAMTMFFVIKYLHVLGAIVILGTGTGIAFFMLMAHRSGDPAFIARTASTVVVADMLFTASAVLLQPVTGVLLMWLSSTSYAEPWLASSLALCRAGPRTRAVLAALPVHRVFPSARIGHDVLGDEGAAFQE